VFPTNKETFLIIATSKFGFDIRPHYYSVPHFNQALTEQLNVEVI